MWTIVDYNQKEVDYQASNHCQDRDPLQDGDERADD